MSRIIHMLIWLSAIVLVINGSARCAERDHGITTAIDARPISIQIVKTPPTDLRNRHYVSNRPPLLPSPFAKLPIGAICPQGWLRKQLELQAEGMNGHLIEISKFCRKEDNAWLAKDYQGHGWWEEVPYWLKGFGDLGYILGDERIEAETREWIEALLASQRKDGWFGPRENLKSTRNKTSMEGEQVRGRPDMWPNALMLSVLRSNYEAKSDRRLIRHMLNYCRWLQRLPEKDYLIHWVAKRRGVEILKNVLWLYNVTGEKWLLDLARKTHRRTNDWTSGISRYHCVDMSECFYEPAMYYLIDQDPGCLAAAERNRRILYDEFGQVPGGMFGGDEKSRLGFIGPRQAIETCAMVEMMHSCETMFTHVQGDISWADRCEDVAFNSYPAALTADMKALRYLTAPNHVVSDRKSKNPDISNGGPMYQMSPHAHRCCQHNHAHGWPYYTEHLWLATGDNGLCAMLYSDSSVTVKVANGEMVTLKQETTYPFGEHIRFTVETKKKVSFPLYLRIPKWCTAPIVKINNKALWFRGEAGKYVRIERTWNRGDTVELTLPRHLSIRTWAANKNLVSVDYGPLTFSLKIGEEYKAHHGKETIRQEQFIREDANYDDWPAYEIFPTTPWNYGLVLKGEEPAQDFKVIEHPWPENNMPWTHDGAPIALTATARRIPEWKLQSNNMIGAIQQSPVFSDEPNETVTLLPMGACRLRLSAFPTIGEGRNAYRWLEPQSPQSLTYRTKDGLRIVASHINNNETLAAIVDGILPQSSGDRSIPRSTFWPHRGAEETIRIEFDTERIVKGIEVYWFDDTGRGACRVPESAKLRFFKDDQWIPVLPSDEVPVVKDAMNRLEIQPVRTDAVEFVVKLKKNFSAGILEMKVF